MGSIAIVLAELNAPTATALFAILATVAVYWLVRRQI